MASYITKKKEFPNQYPADAVKIITAMSFTETKGLNIVGSASIRSQLYAGDYDAYETVEKHSPSNDTALKELASEFKTIIRKLQKMKNAYIMDIKAGAIEDWRISGDFAKSREKIESLRKQKIISLAEEKDALAFLKGQPSKLKILKATKNIKFHIVRWTPKDVLRGYTILRDGSRYTLEQAFSSPAVTKLDVIALIKGRYTELSCIYEFRNNGKTLNKDESHAKPEEAIKEDILFYEAEGNRYKALKRKFSLAKLKNDIPTVERYHRIINSELGKLYVVYNDVKTLTDLLDSYTLNKDDVKDAISGFKRRLSRIYSLEHYLKQEKELLNELSKATTASDPIPILRNIEAKLLYQLNAGTKLQGGF